MNKDLIKAFSQAWLDVQKVYLQGKLISERHMQAEIFCYLRSNAEFENDFNIWIEPKIQFEANGTCSELEGTIPDMLITSNVNHEIVAVVELKYTPLSYLPFEKDVTNLLSFNALRSAKKDCKVALLVDYKTGDYIPDKGFKISQDLLLIYCALAKEGSYAFEEENIFNMWKLASENYLFIASQLEKGEGLKTIIYPKTSISITT
jgi:hypothetical protein